MEERWLLYLNILAVMWLLVFYVISLRCCCVSVAFPGHSHFLLEYWYDHSDSQDIKNQTMKNLI